MDSKEKSKDLNKKLEEIKKKQKEYNVFIDKDLSDSHRGYANQQIELTCTESGKSTRITLIF